jgi:outer membrane receptor for ferric coprogen and ferric-rhodotorulic acid
MSRRWVLQAFLFSNAIGTFSYDQGLTGWWQVGLSLEQAAKLAGNCLQIGRALPSTYTSTSGKMASFKQPRVLAMDWFRPQWKKKNLFFLVVHRWNNSRIGFCESKEVQEAASMRMGTMAIPLYDENNR